MVTKNCVNIGLDNGLLPEPVLTYHKSSENHLRAISQLRLNYQFIKLDWKLLNSHIRHSRAGRALLCWRKEWGRLSVQLASAVQVPMHSVAYMYIDSY